MQKRQILYSSGSNDYELVGHNQTFDECNVLGDPSQIKKMSCGRSHILYETFNGEVLCVGRNDYSQCAARRETHGQLVSKPTNCMFKDEGCEAKPLVKPFKFTTGWFHSTFISSDQKRIYFTGYYSGFSTMNSTPDTCFYDFTRQLLGKDVDFLGNYKITDIGSGDHFFAFVVNHEIIIIVDSHRKVLHVPDLKEFLVFKSGVAFTRRLNGNLYLAKNYPDSIPEYDGTYPYNLRSTSVADSFTFNDGATGKTVKHGHGTYDSAIENYDAFCISYLYEKRKRQFTDTTKFNRINEELQKNPNWEILQFITGSDSIHIMLGVRETKEEQEFKKKLNSTRLSNQISDLHFVN